ncbi:glutamyl-tRNA amidotransferase [Helicobacter sp. 12S02232-10]|uniref:GatB/YqeY domain-containing protein n=1 Tax=Helicobacter sp. 12S02232-10 TaxID=1476197 RepID=UPI000BA669FE|nr:GatB/YqeY domain-containing protein [Helicobacter sp. 12S02232-10]PAF47186.1 glutamyl-tRNA amidotransferase [Helicobacter sp. 12S02232-10]
MSAIKEKMAQDLKIAMKEGNAFRRDTIRMLNSSLKQVEVDQRKVLSDEDVIQILKSAYKQREDAAQAYKNAQRLDLFEKESAEMKIILEYLPKQLDDKELEAEVIQAIQKVGAQGSADMGKVMGVLKHLSQVADGRRISSMVKKHLGQ